MRLAIPGRILYHIDVDVGLVAFAFAFAFAMAVARPVRVLGLAAVMMWCFFLYQIFSPGSSIKAPLGIPNNERDPLLDRELPC